MSKQQSELSRLQNIGPTIERRLNAIGVRSRADLARVGPTSAFRRIQKKFPGHSISVCYYLYSLEGALRGVHWDDLPAGVKKQLSAQVGHTQ